jgi:hypothetical protein
MRLYTPNQLQDAYDKWVATQRLVEYTVFSQKISTENMNERNEAWDFYCDVRDNETEGTNAQRRANYFTRGHHMRLVNTLN